MSDLKPLSTTLTRIQEILTAIAVAEKAPAAARKELAGAVVGHKNWDGYGLREVRGKDLHDRAVASVTDYLIDDLTERKRVECIALSIELDSLRHTLAEQASRARFDLIDDVRRAREYAPPSGEAQ